MKEQELVIKCVFADEGKEIEEVILSSSSSFFKRELEKAVSVSSYHV